MKIWLVRHGQTVENEKGILMGHHHGILTELGEQQAKKTAEKLKGYSFDHIYSSDLKRCIDTAEIIKEYHPDTPLTFTPELREVHYGELQGREKATIDWDSLGDDVMTRKPTGGESLSEVKQRVTLFVQNLLNTHLSHTILFVTHAGVIRQLLSVFLGSHRIIFFTIYRWKMLGFTK